MILHYLDDYFIVNSSFCSCNTDMTKMLETCSVLGVPMNSQKIVGPSTVITFLGIEIDSNQMVCRLPPDKLVDIKLLINSWLSKKTCKKRDLLSLIGKLSFACKVVKPGRIFLRRLINLSTTVNHLDHFIRINKEAREDLKWWKEFLDDWNGVSFIPDKDIPKISLFTDGFSLGMGGFLRSAWFSVPWPESYNDIHITVKELIAVMAAVFTWGNRLSNQSVVICTDNLDIVQIWSSGSSSNNYIMKLIRTLFLFSAKENINLSLRHIYGFKNVKADALSRLLVQKFKALHAIADEHPTVVNPLIWSV